MQEYELVSDTLFLAVSFVDRYLSTQQVMRSRLQLVGVSCMLIAAKYEEIYAPQVKQLDIHRHDFFKSVIACSSFIQYQHKLCMMLWSHSLHSVWLVTP